MPLNEECGLIEWVPNVVVLRPVLNKLYAARGIAPWVSSITYWAFNITNFKLQNQELKAIMDTIRDDPEKTATIFEQQVQTK